MKLTVKKITTLAMLAAMAYIVMAFIRIPIMPAAPFLEYDPKDIFFVIAGFLFGPLESFVIIVLVCLIEMVTVSTSGFRSHRPCSRRALHDRLNGALELAYFPSLHGRTPGGYRTDASHSIRTF